jgi:hypothetical protein
MGRGGAPSVAGGPDQDFTRAFSTGPRWWLIDFQRRRFWAHRLRPEFVENPLSSGSAPLCKVEA